jgi:hypothetical protein
MSIASDDRWQPVGRGVSMNDRDRPKAAQKAGANLMGRVDAANGAGSRSRRLPHAAQRRTIGPWKAAIRRSPF